MKRMALYILFTLFVVSLSSLVNYGFVSGFDIVNAPEKTSKQFSFMKESIDYSYGYEIKPKSKPFILGGHLQIELPLTRLSIDGSATMSYMDYDFEPQSSIMNQDIEIPVSFEEVSWMPYWRFSADATLRYKVFKPVLPAVPNFYIGGGLSLNFIQSVVSEETITDKVKGLNLNPTEQYTLKKDDLLDFESVPGAVVLAGSKFKVPVLPFSIAAEFKYNFLKETDKNEENSSFGSILLLLNTDF